MEIKRHEKDNGNGIQEMCRFFFFFRGMNFSFLNDFCYPTEPPWGYALCMS